MMAMMITSTATIITETTTTRQAPRPWSPKSLKLTTLPHKIAIFGSYFLSIFLEFFLKRFLKISAFARVAATFFLGQLFRRGEALIFNSRGSEKTKNSRNQKTQENQKYQKNIVFFYFFDRLWEEYQKTLRFFWFFDFFDQNWNGDAF